MSLLKQFLRLANIYFLITAIVQSIPQLSPLSPVTAIAPLVFVLVVSMLREGYEDIFRHINDRHTNASETNLLVGGQERKITWANIQVGNILKIYQD